MHSQRMHCFGWLYQGVKMKYQSLLDLNKDKLKKIAVSLNNYKEDP